MSSLDQLPPDQRATLSLLLRQRKSYAEVAAVLGIAERAVHDRAHGALAMLAPARARQLTPQQRLEVGDYLLGQQPGVAERLRTRTFLGTSEPARAWASELAVELAPLAAGALPEIGGPADAPQRLQDLSPAATGARSSRTGGAILLAAIVVAAIVVVVVLSGGGSHAKQTAGKTSSTAKGKTGPKVENQIALRPPKRGSGSVGVVDVLAEGGKRAFFIEAQHLPESKGFYYAIWLYNSHTSSLPLSKSPTVGSTHRLAGGSLLPASAGDYREILLTRETKAHPTHPGRVVLRGPFSLSSH
jgi:Sigma-70, region 4